MANGVPAVEGTTEVLEPPHRLVMTWHVLYDAAMAEEPASRVEWTLSEAADGLTQVDPGPTLAWAGCGSSTG